MSFNLKTFLISLLTTFYSVLLCPIQGIPIDFDQERSRMVEYDLRKRNISDKMVLKAMQKVPRHLFVEPEQASAEILANKALERFSQLGYVNIHVKHVDGFLGWMEHAPFDAILITAVTPKIPKPLIDQLKEGGRMVLSLGTNLLAQSLTVLNKSPNGITKQFVMGVVFVPMMGKVRE